jgi:hypothetical protein
MVKVWQSRVCSLLRRCVIGFWTTFEWHQHYLHRHERRCSRLSPGFIVFRFSSPFIFYTQSATGRKLPFIGGSDSCQCCASYVPHSKWNSAAMAANIQQIVNECGDCRTCQPFRTDVRCCGMTGLQTGSSLCTYSQTTWCPLNFYRR